MVGGGRAGTRARAPAAEAVSPTGLRWTVPATRRRDLLGKEEDVEPALWRSAEVPHYNFGRILLNLGPAWAKERNESPGLLLAFHTSTFSSCMVHIIPVFNRVLGRSSHDHHSQTGTVSTAGCVASRWSGLGSGSA